MKIKDAISRFKNTIKEFYSDSKISKRYLWSIIDTISKELIQRENNFIYNSNLFKYISLDVEEVNLLQDSCVPLDCKGWRVKIPNATYNKFGLIYSFFGSPDMSKSWDIVTPENFISKKKIRGFESTKRYAFIDGDYIYVSEYLPCFKIGIIPDVLNSIECNILEQEAPIPDNILNRVFRMAPEELSIYLQKPYDPVPNKRENQ